MVSPSTFIVASVQPAGDGFQRRGSGAGAGAGAYPAWGPGGRCSRHDTQAYVYREHQPSPRKYLRTQMLHLQTPSPLTSSSEESLEPGAKLLNFEIFPQEVQRLLVVGHRVAVEGSGEASSGTLCELHCTGR